MFNNDLIIHTAVKVVVVPSAARALPLVVIEVGGIGRNGAVRPVVSLQSALDAVGGRDGLIAAS